MEEYWKPLAAFGINMGISFVTGFVQKKVSDVHPSFSTKPIPYRNAMGLGAGTAAATGDPVLTVSGIAGAFTASLLHSGFRKLFRR
jgi:hypothetical protein